MPLPNIKDLPLPALEAWMSAQGERPYRARQVFQWLYQKRARDFAEMTSLSKALRARLAAAFHPGTLAVAARQDSADGSRKLALRLGDGRQVEAVLMPNHTHYTVCISSQVGCAMGCDFCSTARMGLVRNLSAGEIVEQVVEAAREIADERQVRNIVFMGMGEPLHNYEAVRDAIAILQSDHGFGLSARRITVSTSGIVPAIRRFARDGLRVMLAISLNATTDAVRDRLMPVNRRWNIAALLDACREVPADSRYRLTFEYVLIEGLTDTMADARRLVKLMHGMPAKLNLIPFNPFPGVPYRPPPLAHSRAFQRVLLDKGLLATLRLSKGQDIQAACGQLITADRRPGGRFAVAAQAG